MPFCRSRIGHEYSIAQENGLAVRELVDVFGNNGKCEGLPETFGPIVLCHNESPTPKPSSASTPEKWTVKVVSPEARIAWPPTDTLPTIVVLQERSEQCFHAMTFKVQRRGVRVCFVVCVYVVVVRHLLQQR